MILYNTLQIKKYRYDIFLKPLTLRNQIKLTIHKVKSDMSLKDYPHSLEIGVTYKCQLNCTHCGISGQKKNGINELRLSEIKDIIKQSQSLGVYIIVFAGAEPLLRDDIVESVEFAAKRGMITTISTNGILLTPQMIKKLKEKHVTFIKVSIDSADPAIHDTKRCMAGCFKKAETAILNCVAEGVNVVISTYATKDNIHNGDLKRIISFAREIGAQGVRILLSVPTGKWLGCSQILLSEDEKIYLKKLLDPRFVYIEGICNKFTECNSALKQLFYISPYGDVQPCSFVPLTFGNIRDNSLGAIWEKMKQHSFYKNFHGADCIMREQIFFKKYLRHINENIDKLPVQI